MLKNKKVLRYLIYIILILISLTVYIDLSMEFNYQNIVSSSDFRDFEPMTVAIVPGAAVNGNTPSAILEDRLKSALLLYKNKKVKKILLSGDSGDSKYNELKPMLNFMLKYEVKREDIFVDNSGFRTLDTILRAKYIFKIEDAIIVTQKFHQPRAAYIAQHLGIRVLSYEADLHTYKDEVKNRLREFLARNLAWFDLYFIYREYEYNGQKFSINGDGSKTWNQKAFAK
jgi:SanA protein